MPRRRGPGLRRRWSFCVSACAGLTFVPMQQAAAQVLPSQVVPDSLKPQPTTPARPADQLPEMPAKRLSTAPGAEAMSVTLGRVEVRGGFDSMAAAHRRVESALLGRAVSVSDLRRAAASLQQAYDETGYVLARVILPPQTLADGGPLVLLVVDGFIEEIVVDGVAAPLRAAVLDRLRPLLRRPQLTLTLLDRLVLIAGELPGLRLRSALVRGTQEGGTTLAVEGQATPRELQVQLDNRLSSSLGRGQLGASLTLNAPLGWGEQWYAAGAYSARQGSDGHAALQTIGLGAVLPLGAGGTALNPELTYARTEPLPAPDVPATVGRFERASLRLSQPLLRSRTGRLDLHGTVERVTQSLQASAFDVELNHDRYGAARAGLEGARAFAGGAALRLDGTLAAGLGGRGEAETLASGVPTSRVGASAHFRKLQLGLTLQQPLMAAWALEWQLRGQSSFGRPLFKPEQFGLDGRDTLPAFDPGSLNADQGGLTRLQVNQGFGGSVLAYGFVAAAHGRVFDATALDAPSIKAAAVGLGIRSEPNNHLASAASLVLTLEVSTGRSNVAAQRHPQRVDLSAAQRF